MSYNELDRLQIIQESVNRHITQEPAAARIGISIRLDKHLVHRYRNERLFQEMASKGAGAHKQRISPALNRIMDRRG